MSARKLVWQAVAEPSLRPLPNLGRGSGQESGEGPGGAVVILQGRQQGL